MWLWIGLKTTKRGVEQRQLSPVRCGNRGTERMRSGKTRGHGKGLSPIFFAAECTERGSLVKALRFAPTATRRKECGLDQPPSPLLFLLPAIETM